MKYGFLICTLALFLTLSAAYPKEEDEDTEDENRLVDHAVDQIAEETSHFQESEEAEPYQERKQRKTVEVTPALRVQRQGAIYSERNPESGLYAGQVRAQGRFQAPNAQGQFQAPNAQGQFQAPTAQGQFQAPNAQGGIDPNQLLLLQGGVGQGLLLQGGYNGQGIGGFVPQVQAYPQGQAYLQGQAFPQGQALYGQALQGQAFPQGQSLQGQAFPQGQAFLQGQAYSQGYPHGLPIPVPVQGHLFGPIGAEGPVAYDPRQGVPVHEEQQALFVSNGGFEPSQQESVGVSQGHGVLLGGNQQGILVSAGHQGQQALVLNAGQAQALQRYAQALSRQANQQQLNVANYHRFAQNSQAYQQRATQQNQYPEQATQQLSHFSPSAPNAASSTTTISYHGKIYSTRNNHGDGRVAARHADQEQNYQQSSSHSNRHIENNNNEYQQ